MDLNRGLKILQKYIFQTLIFLFPSQLAFHYWPDWSHIYGIRVDYLSLAVYLTDLVLLLLILVSLLKKNAFYRIKFKKSSIYVLFFIALLAIANIANAYDYHTAVFKWLKFLEFSFLVFYVSYKRNFNFNKLVKTPLSISLILFGLIALVQFSFQKSIGGVLYFFGERSFSAVTPGIALYNFFGRTGMRAYSTFSHPNSLSGFFAVSMLLLLLQTGKRNHLVNRISKNSCKLVSAMPAYLKMNGLAVLNKLALAVGIVVLIFSFSIGGATAFLIGILILLITKKRQKFNFMVKSVFWSMILLSLFTLVFSRDFKTKFSNYPHKVSTRLELAKASGEMFSSSPFVGVGLNNFIVGLPKTSLTHPVIWWLQPVHNIFLLILSEAGFLGMIIFLGLLYKANIGLKSKNNRYLTIALLVIIISGAVDHYWLTLQQNQLLLSLVLGLSFRKNIV